MINGKKIFFIFLGLFIIVGIITTTFSLPDDSGVPEEIINAYNAVSGEKLAIADFSNSTDEIVKNKKWSLTRATSTFKNFSDSDGYWSFTVTNPSSDNTWVATSKNHATLKPNRTYKVYAIIKTDFYRPDMEINIGMQLYDANKVYRQSVFSGSKNKTDGWELYEFEFTSGPSIRTGKIYISAYGYSKVKNMNVNKDFFVYDIKVVELPKVDKEPLAKGEGMVFRGGAGNLDMKVTGAKAEGSKITVTTTGSRYIFNTSNNTIEAYQLINKDRMVSSWNSSISLKGLKVLKQSKNEVVLANDTLTFGIQLDGMLLVTVNKKNTPLTLTLTSKIAGKWNRYSWDNVIAKDEYGGFSVNPVVVSGSGKLIKSEVLTKASVDKFTDKGNSDTNYVYNGSAGWQIKWTIGGTDKDSNGETVSGSGEMLAITTFPPREYDWEKSFAGGTKSFHKNFLDGKSGVGSGQTVETYAQNYDIKVGTLWDFYYRSWGMSFGNEFIPYDSAKFKSAIQRLKKAGITPIAYMSFYFWYNNNYDEYVAAVQKQKNTYGIEGIYCDGLGYSDWLSRYETVRRLREVFKDGVIYLHNSDPKFGMSSMPVVDTYADYVLKGEDLPSNGVGRDWQYVKYIGSNYSSGNAIGIMKGNSWTENGQEVPLWKQKLYNIEMNARNRMPDYVVDYQSEEINQSIMKALKVAYEDWKSNGEKGEYYNDIYVPLAKKLVDYALEQYDTTYTQKPNSSYYNPDGYKLKKYIVTFINNGDSDSRFSFQEINSDGSSKATAPADPKKAGNTFKEWQLDGVKYDFDKPVTGNLVLVAAWEAKSYKVTFDSDGGNEVSSQIVTYGKKVTKPTNPQKVGYTFKEWQLNGKAYNFSQSITGDITLKAVWVINEYNVVFDSNGGTKIENQKVKYSDKVAIPDNPTKNGYVFKEWQLDEIKYDFNMPVIDNIKLIAIWEEEGKTYTVTFDTNGGSAIEAQIVSINEKVLEPAIPTKEGYIFDYWQLDGKKYDFNTPVTDDLTLVAIWKEVPKEACYQDLKSGKYFWGVYEKDYQKIEGIVDKNMCYKQGAVADVIQKFGPNNKIVYIIMAALVIVDIVCTNFIKVKKENN